MSLGLVPVTIGLRNRFARAVWGITWCVFFRPSPVPFHAWRALLLRLFGGRIAAGVHVYPSARVFAPWNLTMHERSCLGHFVDCYNVEQVELGRDAIVSQHSMLCTASHDYEDVGMPVVAGKITIGDRAWVTARVFVGPGVSIGEGAVALANSTVVRDVEPWSVVAGCPARWLKRRNLRNVA